MATLPKWLDPKSEVPKTAPPHDRAAFVVGTMERLLELGCDPRQAAGVTANAANESAWGRSIYCGNGFGWKITSSYAASFKQRTGESAPWCAAPATPPPAVPPGANNRASARRGPDGGGGGTGGPAVREASWGRPCPAPSRRLWRPRA